MKRLSLLIFFSTFCSFFLQAQNNPNQQLKVNSKFSQTSTQNLVNSRVADTCLDKKYSIVFYLINDSVFSLPNSSAAMNSYSLNLIMSVLNRAFAPICVSFEHCKTEIIPAYVYNKWSANRVGNHVISTWYHENTINVYLPNEVMATPPPPDDPERSYTYFYDPNSPVTRNAIVIEKAMSTDSSIATKFRGGALLHVFGHFFGLRHTSDEINPGNMPSPGPVGPITTFEYVDRTNCSTHGDGFCDTDADPWPNSWIGPTGSVDCSGANAKDGKGNFYTPPFDNVMSLYNCRIRYSPQQYQAMARYMIKERKYLH